MKLHIVSILILGTSLLAAPYESSRTTIDGGGVMNSTGGAFELSGTIGQPDAGRLAGGDFELTGGFWFELRAGDCNEDGIVGRADHRGFADCVTGPIPATLSAVCNCFDFNGDGVVDLQDAAGLQNAFNGH